MVAPTLLILLTLIQLCLGTNLVTNSTDTIYLENKNKTSTIGYYFNLDNNVLSVLINATNPGGSIQNVTYAILPNLILEYNNSVSANDTSSVFGFLDLANNNTDWGKGLEVSQPKKEIFQISGNWTNSDDRGDVMFDAKMFVAAKPTTYRGIDISPNEILMLFSILNYTFQLQSSTIAFDEILLSGANLKNNTFQSVIRSVMNDQNGALLINNTALVDGMPQNASASTLDQDNFQFVAGNATNFNITGLKQDNVLISFANSGGAKNITFEQRLVLNLTLMEGNSEDVSNGGTSLAAASPKWLKTLFAITSVVIAVPLFII